MMSYDALPFLLKSVFRFGLYLLLCCGIGLLPVVIRRKSPGLILSALLAVGGVGGMYILYASDARAQKLGYTREAVSRWFCEEPVTYPLLIILAAAALLIFICIRERRLRRTTLTTSAIKESIDHLPTGLCFCAENGRVLLVNHCMNRLCHTLLGRDLQNAAQMWEDLRDGAMQPGIVRLAMGDRPSFRLPDGTVWSFSRTELQGMLQITAVDTTRLHGLAAELEQNNAALEALYQRLKDYEQNVEALTRERERLETKIGIHSELGQTLLATRSYLLDTAGEIAVPTDAWKRSIALLRQNTVERTERFTLHTLVRTADAFGITVEVDGRIPVRRDVEKLFLEAAAEALTNAVRHANARTLRICFSETSDAYRVSFENDGTRPTARITEGGGLGSLRRKAETSGGAMEIRCEDAYNLTITMPKGRGESV